MPGADVRAESAEERAVERVQRRQQVAVQGAQDEGRLPSAQPVPRRRQSKLLRRRVLAADQVSQRSHRHHSVVQREREPVLELGRFLGYRIDR